MIRGSLDNAVTSPIDLFVDNNSFENWDLGKDEKKDKKSRKLMFSLKKMKKTVKSLKASLPEDSHDQDTRLLSFGLLGKSDKENLKEKGLSEGILRHVFEKRD